MAYEREAFLLASLVVGPDEEKIATFLDMPMLRAKQLALEARRGKIWTDGTVDHGWNDPVDGEITFGFDLSVMKGEYRRAASTPDAPGKRRYEPVQNNHAPLAPADDVTYAVKLHGNLETITSAEEYWRSIGVKDQLLKETTPGAFVTWD